jgi:hypothetical protein
MRKDVDPKLMEDLRYKAVSIINAYWASGDRRVIEKSFEQQREEALELLALYYPIMDDDSIVRAMKTARVWRGETRYW